MLLSQIFYGAQRDDLKILITNHDNVGLSRSTWLKLIQFFFNFINITTQDYYQRRFNGSKRLRCVCFLKFTPRFQECKNL